MKRHPFQLITFVLGVWLIAGGALAIASDYESIGELAWLAPTAFAATGLAIAGKAVFHTRS